MFILKYVLLFFYLWSGTRKMTFPQGNWVIARRVLAKVLVTEGSWTPQLCSRHSRASIRSSRPPPELNAELLLHSVMRLCLQGVACGMSPARHWHNFKLWSPWVMCDDGNQSSHVSIDSGKGTGLCVMWCGLTHMQQEKDRNCFHRSACAVFPGLTPSGVVLRLFLENELW